MAMDSHEVFRLGAEISSLKSRGWAHPADRGRETAEALQQSIKQVGYRFQFEISTDGAPYRLAEALADLCFCGVEADYIAFEGQAGLFARIIHHERAIRLIVTPGHVLVQLEPNMSSGIPHIARPASGKIKP
jgi:hypothetical protein